MTPTDKELIDRDKAIEAIEVEIAKWSGAVGANAGLRKAIRILSSSPLVEETKEMVWWCPMCDEQIPDERIARGDRCNPDRGGCGSKLTMKHLHPPQAEPPRAKEGLDLYVRCPHIMASAQADCKTCNGEGYRPLPAPSVPERKVTPDEVWELAHRLCMQSTRGAMLNQYRDWLRALPRESTEEMEEAKEAKLDATLIDLTRFMANDEMDEESARQIVEEYHRDRNRKSPSFTSGRK
jgi:hypothetical protein